MGRAKSCFLSGGAVKPESLTVTMSVIYGVLFANNAVFIRSVTLVCSARKVMVL